MVGAAQALALIPGISRSGVTMCAGLLINMRHEEAATYTFMLATPISAAAGVLEVPTLFSYGPTVIQQALVGGARRDHSLHQRALPDPLLPHGAAGPLRLLVHRGWSDLVSLYSDARRVGKRQSAGHGTVP